MPFLSPEPVALGLSDGLLGRWVEGARPSVYTDEDCLVDIELTLRLLFLRGANVQLRTCGALLLRAS